MIQDKIYEALQPNCKAIYKSGSSVLPFIKNKQDIDLVVFINWKDYNEYQKNKDIIHSIINQNIENKCDVLLDRNNGKLNRYYCLYPYMEKLAGDSVSFATLSVEGCKRIVEKEFCVLNNKLRTMQKKWYLLVYDYYILKNNLSYNLTDEQKEILNSLHDNNFDNSKFEELKLEIEYYLKK